jgi:hypothetical protein
MFERIVFTFDEQGNLKGGAAYPWENGGQGNPIDLPTQSEQLAILGNIADQAATVQAATTELEEKRREVDDLKKMITDLETDLQRLTKRLAAYELPPLQEIIEPLKVAGFYDWLASAVQVEASLLDEVVALRQALEQSDLVSIKNNYAAIVETHPPTSDRLQAWQSVLDEANVDKSFIAFVV